MDDVNLNYPDDTWIDHYLNNRMDESERGAFELAMMEAPTLLQRVQLLDTFKQGLGSESAALSLREANVLREAKVVRELPASLPLRTWIRQPLSLAASVLVVGLGIQVLSSGLSSPQLLPLRSVVVLKGTRGGDTVTFSGAGPYLFQVDAGLGTGTERFDLSLRNVATGAPVIAEQDLQSDGNGWVRVALDGQLQGDFDVELAWQDAKGNARTREYRVSLTP